MSGICVECGDKARHWGKYLCESCFREALKEDNDAKQSSNQTESVK